ncbi:hypothetical protein [Bradyrhizobium erythrophlei]|uniref:Uncharacterized protein n=1 Tax=Bradyrhizobium erythrophlei TaxID=1437360 RepID=A0A1M5NB14_9BRAD|nr:hypothetical protein [Bradyrhizobium erythrophlei]SHG86678.1 hypothetical protein SAMN05443248_2908 [Bradyrhizobium erythrophlei]
MAKLSRDEREAIAEKRLLSVLATATIANQRTLEQKISDAGPYGQRVDPHVLTDVRKRLMKEGIIGVASSAGSPWFFASNTSKAAWEARLQILLAVYQPYLAIAGRIGQALEIATYRALSEIPNADFEGRFKELDGHDDSTMYKKEEPTQHIGTRSLKGDERLDFILRTANAGPIGIECKNVRHWMYPHVNEIKDTLRKCLALNAVPVLIARRIPYVTFAVLSHCGLIIHQTYNQLFPAADATLSAQVAHKTMLGYHDIRTTNQPDARLLKFITQNLPSIAAAARQRFEGHKDLLEPFSNGEMNYVEFAARVLRRSRGQNEDFPTR